MKFSWLNKKNEEEDQINKVPLSEEYSDMAATNAASDAADARNAASDNKFVSLMQIIGNADLYGNGGNQNKDGFNAARQQIQAKLSQGVDARKQALQDLVNKDKFQDQDVERSRDAEKFGNDQEQHKLDIESKGIGNSAANKRLGRMDTEYSQSDTKFANDQKGFANEQTKFGWDKQKHDTDVSKQVALDDPNSPESQLYRDLASKLSPSMAKSLEGRSASQLAKVLPELKSVFEKEQAKLSTKSAAKQEFETLAPPDQEVVKDLARKNASKIAIANQIEATMSNWDSLPEDQKLTTGRMLLKVLNSTEGADAIGVEESKRLGSKLEYAMGNFTNDNPVQFGRDLPGFKDQTTNQINAIRGAVQANEAEIARRSGKAPQALSAYPKQLRKGNQAATVSSPEEEQEARTEGFN